MPSTLDFTPRIDNDADLRQNVADWVDCSTVDPLSWEEWVVVQSDVGDRFSEQFEELRQRVALPAGKYALLLGASRRTLYHWLETGRPREVAAETLELLVTWSNRLSHHVSSVELERLFDPAVPGSPGEYLIRLGRDEAEDRVWEIVEDVSRPRKARRLEELADDMAGEPPKASPEELKAALDAMSTPREPVAIPPQSEPPELTY